MSCGTSIISISLLESRAKLISYSRAISWGLILEKDSLFYFRREAWKILNTERKRFGPRKISRCKDRHLASFEGSCVDVRISYQ